MKISMSARGRIWGFLILGLVGVSPPARGSFSFGDAGNFAVLYGGAGSHKLLISDGGINGNIGLGDSGGPALQARLNGPLAINGNIEFAGSVKDQISPGVTVNGSISANNVTVQSDLNGLYSLSGALGAETGTALALNLVNGANQIINAANGTLDASGNRVFDLSSLRFANGATMTISGSASDYVVFNINANASFGGRIQLAGGLTSDRVLFNILGGHTLDISANGATLSGVFLDPNGAMSINHSVLDGRFFGGGNNDMQIGSGAYIYEPIITPEPTTLLTGVLLLLPFGASAVKGSMKLWKTARG